MSEAIDRKKKTISEESRKLHSMGQKKKEIEEEIEGLTKKDPIVSEHAILRYLMRICGLNQEQVAEQILKDNKGGLVKNGNYNNGEYQIRIVDNVIVTVI